MKVLIVDDEPLARRRLRGLLAGQAGVTVVGEAGSGEEALAQVAAQTPDLVLLDIAMPGLDGLETARRLSSCRPAPAVVFCTAYDDHALSAFEASAIDYLMKPVRGERLAVALERARAFLAGRGAAEPATPARRDHLCARLGTRLRVIPLDEVRYLQAGEKYVTVHHVQGEDVIEEPLRALEEAFGDCLLRIHRNCLVAHDRLRELRRDGHGRVHAVLDDGTALEVSRRCLGLLRQRLRQG